MIIFDLDGTLALGTHREHLARAQQWDAYFALCEGDAVNWPIVRVFGALLLGGSCCAIWTGRRESTRAATLRWLHERAGLPTAQFDLKMRAREDKTPDHELKAQWLGEYRAGRGREDPISLVFEDRARVVAMWRSEGIVCAQVAEGDF